jgi:NTP-dependent ternary conflict system VMAP-like protein/putative serine esterase DUF676
MSDVFSLVAPGKPVMDVVFLHGLGGDARGTWAVGKTFWPSWLGEDVPGAAVWLVGYAASPSGWLGRAMPIQDRAVNVLARLQNEGVGNRPLIFVTHSMGGILAKQMLLHAASSPAYETFATAAKGVVFLATPHLGADMASFLANLKLALRATAALKDLQRNGAHLRDINVRYRDWVHKSGTSNLVFFEGYKTRGVRIVDTGSADPGLAGAGPISVDSNHFEICKIASRNSLVYGQVRTFVAGIREEVTSGDPDPPLPSFSSSTLQIDSARSLSAHVTTKIIGNIPHGEDIAVDAAENIRDRYYAKSEPATVAQAMPRGRSAKVDVGRDADAVNPVATTIGGITPSQARRLVHAFADSAFDFAPEVVEKALREGVLDTLLGELADTGNDEDRLVAAQLGILWRAQRRTAGLLRHFMQIPLPALRTYYDLVPDRQLAPSLTALDEVCEYLAEFGEHGEAAPLLRYVARLEAITGTVVSDEWFDLPADQLARLRATERNHTVANGGCHLVIQLPDTEWTRAVNGYLLTPDHKWTKHVAECAADEQGARDAVNSLIRWAHERVAGEPTLALGFLASRGRFDDVPERWTYVDELSGELPLCEEYPVVLHSGDRLRVSRARSLWRTRTKLISDNLNHAEPEILWIDGPLDARMIINLVRSSSAACVVFMDVPGRLRGELSRDPLVAAINPGAPFVIWLDETPADWAAARELITILVRNGQFADLPARAWRLRQDDTAPWPRHGVRVLWDDHKLLPEFGQLGGIEVGTP